MSGEDQLGRSGLDTLQALKDPANKDLKSS